MLETVSESRFNMWRAIFAMAHADNIITKEEEKFMREGLENYPFSKEQRQILEEDIKTAQNVGDCFQKITSHQDRSDFFVFARLLVWCDGDFDIQEQRILTEIQKIHISTLDFKELMEDVQLSFDDDEKEAMRRRTNALYEDIKNDKPSNGGFFGGILRKMLKPQTDQRD